MKQSLKQVLGLGSAVAGSLFFSAAALRRPQDLPVADSLFRAGKFDAAEQAYGAVLRGDARSGRATLQLGRIALLRNRLADAERLLSQAARADTGSKEAQQQLADLYYRQGDYARAAALLRATGAEDRAKQLESFAGLEPYRLEGQGDSTRISFVVTDPLPIVRLSVNGKEPAYFFIDTGAHQVYLDRDFAQELGIPQCGNTTDGVYAGGQKAQTGRGRLESLALGDFMVRNVPVTILPTRRFVLAGYKMDGAIGTDLFSHFLTTLDYPGGQLVLRRKSKANHDRFLKQAGAEKQIVVPFWWEPPHFMVAWGTVNGSGPQLWFVDTGFAGGGLTVAPSTVEAGKIQLQEDKARVAAGGGGDGSFRSVPFVADAVTFGGATERQVRGGFGAFAAAMEYAHGFRIAGIISHTFFKPYALTFDFEGPRFFLKRAVSR